MSRVISIMAFVAVLAFLQCRGTAANGQDNFFLVQTDNKFVAIIKYLDEDSEVYKCRIFTDPAVIEGVKKITSKDKIHQVSEDEMDKLRAECDALENVRMEGTPAMEESRAWDIIFPGTNWCGDGNISKYYDDLGSEEDTDRCCRAHDMCGDIMDAGETKNNLTNDSPFTSLSCKCDNDFYDCLKKVGTMTSFTVGSLYFTLLRRECYEKDHPFTTKCKRYSYVQSALKTHRRMKNLGMQLPSLILNPLKTMFGANSKMELSKRIMGTVELSCLEYEKDTSKPEVYQWVPAKYFK